MGNDKSTVLEVKAVYEKKINNKKRKMANQRVFQNFSR